MAPGERAAGELRCAFCGAPLAVVHVHGHGQCSRCGTNVEPCCNGDQHGTGGWTLAPDLLHRLFEQLGGSHRAVTAQALRTALAEALDVPLAQADEVIALALDLGHLERVRAEQPVILRLGPAAGHPDG